MGGKQVLGFIDCPCCKFKQGMRVTLDKNNQPFGFCEADCGAQLRVGGNAGRVAKFLLAYPHIDRAMRGESESNLPPPVSDKKPVMGGFNMGEL